MFGAPTIAAHRVHLFVRARIERHGSYSGAARTRVPSGMQSRDDSLSNRHASPNDDTRSAAPADVVPDAPSGRDAGESNNRKFARRIDCTDQVESDGARSTRFGGGRHSNSRGRHGTSFR